MNQIPEDFKKIVENIRKGNPVGPDYKGILYKDMFRWANFRLKDQRTKKQTEKKLNKNQVYLRTNRFMLKNEARI